MNERKGRVVDYSYAISRDSNGKPLCDEAGRHEMEAEGSRVALQKMWPGTGEFLAETRFRDHALNAAATSHKAHTAGVCSCHVAVAIRRSREVAPLADRMERAANTGRQARSPRTLEEYARCWRKFTNWCASDPAHGAPLPASIATLVLYADHLVKEEDYAASSLTQAFAGIRYHHNMARLPKEERPDWEDIRLLEMLKASRRDITGRRAIKRAKPICNEDMRDAFDMLDVDTLRERRDLAILALAYAGCRRRSEITGLDYAKRGEGSHGTGILEVTPDGIWIILLRSKTSQEGEPKKFFINRKHATRSCAAIEAWIKIARIEPGTPVLRGINGVGDKTGEVAITHREGKEKPYHVFWPPSPPARKHVGYYATLKEAIAARDAKAAEMGMGMPSPVRSGRYEDGNINLVIQQRMFEILQRRMLANSKRKRLRDEDVAACRAQAKEYSGHSGRRGSIRDAFEAGATRADVRMMSGHVAGSAMLDLYSEETDQRQHRFMVGSGL